jgi:hypothetical protein
MIDVALFSFIGIVSRLAPHPWNMTSVGAMSVFSGAKLGIKKAWIITLITLLITDLVKGLHPVMWATYGAFLVAAVIGKYVARKTTILSAAGAVLLSSILFFLITNFAVWLIPNSVYPKTLTGLFDCYMMAIPFFRNSLFGDALYSTVFFGGYAFVGLVRSAKAVRS